MIVVFYNSRGDILIKDVCGFLIQRHLFLDIGCAHVALSCSEGDHEKRDPAECAPCPRGLLDLSQQSRHNMAPTGHCGHTAWLCHWEKDRNRWFLKSLGLKLPKTWSSVGRSGKSLTASPHLMLDITAPCLFSEYNEITMLWCNQTQHFIVASGIHYHLSE